MGEADGAAPHPIGKTIVGPGSTSAGQTATLVDLYALPIGAEVALWRFTGSV